MREPEETQPVKSLQSSGVERTGIPLQGICDAALLVMRASTVWCKRSGSAIVSTGTTGIKDVLQGNCQKAWKSALSDLGELKTTCEASPQIQYLLQTAALHGKFVKSNLKAYISHYEIEYSVCFKNDVNTMKVHFNRTEGALIHLSA